MEEQGLTTRASASRPERPVSNSRLVGILRDTYYTGIIRYKGKLFVGRHDAVISKESFLKVQEILDQRNRQGDRDIVHFHYLKGMLYCGECREAGRRSRLLYSQNTGNGGTYEYLICTAKQRRLCSMPGIRVDQIEEHIARAVAAERFTAAVIEDMKSLIADAVNDLLTTDKEAKAQLRKQLDKLEAQEERLIEIAANGTVPISKLRRKLEQTTLQKEAVKEKLDLTTERLKYGAETAIAYIDLLREPGELYRNASDSIRRDLLTAYFNRLIVYVEDNTLSVEGERNQANDAIRDFYKQYELTRTQHDPTQTKTPRTGAGSLDSQWPRTGSLDHDLSKTVMAGVPGLEPRTTEPESAVLPITPYPNARSEDRAD